MDSGFRSQAVTQLRAAFEHWKNPLLLADDHRRWVTGNAAACELLGVAREEVPWSTMDDFTPPSERRGLEEKWDAFLSGGEAEGLYELYVPDRGAVPVEFSATANVLPARHLAVFLPQEGDSTGPERRGEPGWMPVGERSSTRSGLTDRERDVVTLVASGLQGDAMAERLQLSPETIKSHVDNAMSKLGVHTRAHAVAVALVTGQITWEIYGSTAPGRLSGDQPPPG